MKEKEIIELTKQLEEIADDYGQAGKKEKLLPSKYETETLLKIIEEAKGTEEKPLSLSLEMQNLERAVERIRSIVHFEAVNKICNT
jgi:hypothetical protein